MKVNLQVTQLSSFEHVNEALFLEEVLHQGIES